MFTLFVSSASVAVEEKEVITAGRVGLQCSIRFSPDWDGLVKTAVFDGTESRDVIVTGERVTIPAECLAAAGDCLKAGFYGKSTDGAVVIPTVWASLGMIEHSVYPSGREGAAPTPDVVAQIQQAAANAEKMARSVREDADLGKFNGGKGEKGDNGGKGDTGPAGEAGGFYTPAVTQPDANTIRMSFTPSKEDMPAVEPVDITLPAGGGGTTTHGIVWNLVNVTSSNNAVFVADGASMVAVLTPADGYTLGDVTITMGGEVVTGAWNADTATVTIQSVTGDVVISCAGVEQTGPVDTSPVIAGYDMSLDSVGSASTTTGGCYTDFYAIPDGASSVVLYSADAEGVSFSNNGKLQYWNDAEFLEYWSTAVSLNTEKSYTLKSGATRFRTSLAINGIDDSYAYDIATGYIYFAGANTKYYGMTNIDGSTSGESAVSVAAEVDNQVLESYKSKMENLKKAGEWID